MAGEFRPASITLIRHAESAANVSPATTVAEVPPQLRGVPDHKVPLTERGRAQAAATGAALARLFPEGFDYVYHSPYLRTTETAAKLVEGFDGSGRARMEARMWPDLFLREQSFGDADLAMAAPGFEAFVEDAYRRFEVHRRTAGRFFSRPANGDSWADVCERTHTFLGKLFQPARAGAHILVVSHAVPIATFRYHLERLSEDEVVEVYQKDRPANCGLTRFEYTTDDAPRRWRLAYWNRCLS